MSTQRKQVSPITDDQNREINAALDAAKDHLPAARAAFLLAVTDNEDGGHNLTWSASGMCVHEIAAALTIWLDSHQRKTN